MEKGVRSAALHPGWLSERRVPFQWEGLPRGEGTSEDFGDVVHCSVQTVRITGRRPQHYLLQRQDLQGQQWWGEAEQFDSHHLVAGRKAPLGCSHPSARKLRAVPTPPWQTSGSDSEKGAWMGRGLIGPTEEPELRITSQSRTKSSPLQVQEPQLEGDARCVQAPLPGKLRPLLCC